MTEPEAADDTENHSDETRWWQWPARWVRDQKFWQQVAASTIASLIVAFILYIGAITLGYIQGPQGRPLIALILQVLVLPGITIWAAIKLVSIRYQRQIDRGDFSARGYPWYIAIPATIGMVWLFFVASNAIQTWGAS
ncbi:hypothetical protein [Rhodococcus rhodochrous]|uniref:hypothetical protein n=1 Tax=Rhodococcus rhodochrous TaxID=1829 RepID=UPI00177ABD57|nr:hypothetical protein [Rhodococcus rhodochrous]QOH56229.1 hypothetical protein C6Y44_09835 [Rhodococcus rhodochrous]